MPDGRPPGDTTTGPQARRGIGDKLTSTYRWHPGGTGIPYWQMLLGRVILGLIALSLVAYLLGSPSWGGALVLGIVIGAVIVPDLAHRAASDTRPVVLVDRGSTPVTTATAPDEVDPNDSDYATDAKSILGPAYTAQRDRDVARAAASVQASESATASPRAGPSLLERIEAARSNAPDPAGETGWTCPTHGKSVTKIHEASGRVYTGCPECNAFARGRPALCCTEHPDCGPVTRAGHSGHGHGPNESTGLWCWHFDEWFLGRPDEEAAEGSDLAWRRAQQAAVNGGDPFLHKTYPTDH